MEAIRGTNTMGTLSSRSAEFGGNQISSLANAKVQQELNRRRECRKAIVDHALQMMNTAGFPRECSIAELIAKIAIPRDVFQRLFEGVDDFEEALVDEGWKDLMRQLRLVATQMGGRVGLERITESYRSFVKDKSGTYYIAMCKGRDSQVGQRFVSRLGRLLFIVLASCELGDLDLNHAAKKLADVLHGLAVIEFTGDKFGRVDETVTHILQVYLNDLFNKSAA